MPKQRILMVCPTAWDDDQLTLPRLQKRYRFVRHGRYPTDAPQALEPNVFVDDAARRFADQGIDGVVSTHDYPGCILAADIARRLGLSGACPAALLRVQHKVVARQLMQRVVPDCTPAFARVELGASSPPDLPFPFFIKPAKSVTSILAREVRNEQELEEYLALAASHVCDFVRPFNELWRRHLGHDEPDGSCFIAEEIISGDQVTVEGFVHAGEVILMGVVDSVMIPGTRSFARFNYPSRLPESLLERMRAATRALVHALVTPEAGEWDALGDCQFNVELSYDATTDALRIIEINPRMSYQFSDMFGAVDGHNSYEILCAMACGERPTFARGGGPFGVASSFVMRRSEDHLIEAYPSADDVAAMTAAFPDLRLKLFGEPDQHLSDLSQDMESFRYGIANLSGRDEADLERRFEKVQAILRRHIQLRPKAGTSRSAS